MTERTEDDLIADLSHARAAAVLRKAWHEAAQAEEAEAQAALEAKQAVTRQKLYDRNDADQRVVDARKALIAFHAALLSPESEDHLATCEAATGAEGCDCHKDMTLAAGGIADQTVLASGGGGRGIELRPEYLSSVTYAVTAGGTADQTALAGGGGPGFPEPAEPAQSQAEAGEGGDAPDAEDAQGEAAGATIAIEATAGAPLREYEMLYQNGERIEPSAYERQPPTDPLDEVAAAEAETDSADEGPTEEGWSRPNVTDDEAGRASPDLGEAAAAADPDARTTLTAEGERFRARLEERIGNAGASSVPQSERVWEQGADRPTTRELIAGVPYNAGPVAAPAEPVATMDAPPKSDWRSMFGIKPKVGA